MASEHDQNGEYHRRRQPGITLDSRQDCSDSTQHSSTEMLLGLPGLMRSAGIEGSCNAPVRAEGMRQMQQTHGNRAVQRALSANGAAGRVAIQRETWTEHSTRYMEEMRNRPPAFPGNEASTSLMAPPLMAPLMSTDPSPADELNDFSEKVKAMAMNFRAGGSQSHGQDGAAPHRGEVRQDPNSDKAMDVVVRKANRAAKIKAQHLKQMSDSLVQQDPNGNDQILAKVQQDPNVAKARAHWEAMNTASQMNEMINTTTMNRASVMEDLSRYR